MAWNPSPEVAVARDAAKRLDAKQCIIIYLTDNQIGMASFGKTKALCAEAGRLGDIAYDAVKAALAQRLQHEETMRLAPAVRPTPQATWGEL